jgi:trigger factor
MANKKVTFTVNINSVKEVLAPKLDDDFAAKAGPFDTLKALKEDIKRQLEVERQQQMEREFESELVRDITAKSKVVVPQILIDEQIDRMWQEMKQNLVYRGQTVAEFLESEAKSEDAYKSEVLKPQAEERVKASLVLTEISEKEKLDVTPEELEIRIQLLKSQYKDQAMQSELDKPENRNDIASRLLTEKTVSKLKEYVTAK